MKNEITVRNLPIVVEPCVNVIEAVCEVTDNSGVRRFPIQLFRLDVNRKTVRQLPFVPTTATPHVFSPVLNVKESPLLAVFDHMGRLVLLCQRNAKQGGRYTTWEKYEVFDEVAGRTTAVASARLRFKDEQTRTRFLELAQTIINQNRSDVVDYDCVQEFVKIMSGMRMSPVLVPTAAINPVKEKA